MYNTKMVNYILRININEINELIKISDEIQEIFKMLFIEYMAKEESFGCCSKYIECSDRKHCVQENIRFRFGCSYKKNLDNNKIFYGKNKNI